MSQTSALGAAAGLGTSLDALAALAAYARIETERLPVDPAVRAALADIAREVLGRELSDDEDLGPVIGLARTFVLQARDLIEDPGRSGGWDQIDPALLQSVGRLSASLASAFSAAESRMPDLAEALTRPGARFLDVGTGTGWLAMAVAQSHPGLAVVGLDVFEPALKLARDNVRTQGLEGRVSLRTGDVVDLDEPEGYDVIWLPMPFLAEATVPAAVAAAVGSLRPGGWVLPGTFAGSGGRLSELLMDLRTLRSGGRPWRSAEVVDLLTAAGLAGAHEIERTWVAPVNLYAGVRS